MNIFLVTRRKYTAHIFTYLGDLHWFTLAGSNSLAVGGRNFDRRLPLWLLLLGRLMMILSNFHSRHAHDVIRFSVPGNFIVVSPTRRCPSRCWGGRVGNGQFLLALMRPSLLSLVHSEFLFLGS